MQLDTTHPPPNRQEQVHSWTGVTLFSAATETRKRLAMIAKIANRGATNLDDSEAIAALEIVRGAFLGGAN